MISINELILSAQQKQTFSQQAIQIVEILQMNAQQLEAFLNDQLLSNPLIDPDASYQSNCESLDVHIQEEWDDEPSAQISPNSTSSVENCIPQAAMNRSQQLFLQLLNDVHSKTDEHVLRYLIDCLDPRGFLTDDPDILCETLGLDSDSLERYIQILQKLEPTGLGARSLQECLLLQLDRSDSPHAPLAKRIVSDCLEDCASCNLKKIAKALDARESAVKQALSLIRTLNPRPLNGFEGAENAAYIQPDIIVERDGNGFNIRLRKGNIHRLLIDRSYLELAATAPPDVRTYIQEKNRDITRINRCLEQRETTLTRLAVLLLERQRAFFLRGPGCLQPMDQAELSAVMEVSPSTVSRAIRDKYLQCEWGVFPLKMFFPRAAKSGGDATVDNIKERIRAIIDEEDKQHPLSDQKICNMLAKKGVSLSRRVIAKYRSELGIADTSRRRLS